MPMLKTPPTPTVVDFRLRWRPFPVHLLPEPLCSYVLGVAESIGCDPVYVAMPTMAVLSSLIAKTVKVRLTKTWTEPPILWCVTLGRSGTVKSPGYDLALGPLRSLQEQLYHEHRDEVEVYRRDMAVWDADMRQWKKDPESGDPPVEPEQPQLQRLYTSDVTIEALAVLMQNSKGAMLLARDELAAWLGSFDRYHSAADAAQWIECYYAQPLVIDRKSAPTIYVDRGAVCVTGTLQPATAKRCFGQRLYESGLVARLLMAWPPQRPKRWSEKELPKEIATSYFRLVQALYDIRRFAKPDREIKLTPDALKVFGEFVNSHGQDTFDAHDDNVSAMLSKLEGYAARLALLIEHIRWAAGGDIGPGPSRIRIGSVKAALELVAWFSREEERIYRALRETDIDDDPKAIQPPSKLEVAESFLRRTLPADGSWFSSSKLSKLAKKERIAPRTLDRAKQGLGVISDQIRSGDGRSVIKRWVCRLPPPLRQQRADGGVDDVGDVDGLDDGQIPGRQGRQGRQRRHGADDGEVGGERGAA